MNKCPNCGSDNIAEFAVLERVAYISTSDLTLGCCRNCGIIFNIDFAEKYLKEKELEK